MKTRYVQSWKNKSKNRGKLASKPVVLLFFLCGNIVIAGLFPGCQGSGPRREAGFVPGTYAGTGRGYNGPIQVEIQLSPAGIEDIAIISHEESVYPGTAAMEELLDAVLETGATDVDVVSGATFSSRGFLEAVENALEKASGNAQWMPHL